MPANLLSPSAQSQANVITQLYYTIRLSNESIGEGVYVFEPCS